MASVLDRIPGKKRFLAKALARAGVSRVLLRAQVGKLTIYNFHRISDGEPQTDFDDTVFGPTVESFREQIRWLSRRARPVSEADLIDFFEKKKPLPNRAVAVTFDDGYRDNFELALPVLREFAFPAFFFIPTEAISASKLGWWDQIYWCLKKSTREEIEFHGNRYRIPARSRLLELAEVFIREMKSRPAAETQVLVKELADACQVSLPTQDQSARELMTWEQIQQADRSGISIGSHTHTHRVLSTLTVEEQRRELAESKRILEEKLGHPVHSLAYPVGGYEHFHLESMELAKEVGYKLAFSFLTGVNDLSRAHPFDLRRVDWNHDIDQYAASLALPMVFAKRTCIEKVPRSIHS